MKPLIVVYDGGAAQPGDIAVGLGDWATWVFAAEPNEHTRGMEPLLSQFAPIVWIDDLDRATAELRAHDPGGIVTFSEKALRVTAELAGRLGLPHHGPAGTAVLTDKWRQRSALRSAGVDSVRFHRVDSADQWSEAVAHVGLPAVLKPAFGGASRNTFLVSDEADGRRTVERLLAAGAPGYDPEGALVLEEYLVGRDCAPFGDYVSVEQLVQDGEVTDIAVTGKFPMVPPFRETGRFWPSPLDPEETRQVFGLARRAVTALGITTGLTHTEAKLTPEGPRLIEVNGRLGGGINELSRRATGTDLIELAGRIALGERVGVPPLPHGRTIYQIIHPAPREPCELVGVAGTDEIRALPEVSLYRPYARPGTRLEGGVHTRELDIVIGETGGLSDLATVFKEVESRLRFTFAFDGRPGARTVTGAELGLL
ncbi:acetyl-CoA carboxylase biotin carboxylase subunit family protein [Streptomyces sp. NPDC051016]|uniref:acetyl-CoA carboxylase biotin carboxylase subunit family protein n=1 Tax=Streptomyces sp. NPDC051016 TaxID=3365638 RepID=UPI003794A840